MNVLQTESGGKELVQVLYRLLEFRAQHGLVNATLFLLDQIEDDDGRAEAPQKFIEMLSRNYRQGKVALLRTGDK